jgi:hypothetical protein
MHARTFIAMKNAHVSLEANSPRFTQLHERLWRSYKRASAKRSFVARVAGECRIEPHGRSKRIDDARSYFSAGSIAAEARGCFEKRASP